MTPEPRMWPRYLLGVVNGFVLFNAYSSWVALFDYLSWQPILRGPSAIQVLIPLSLTALGVGLLVVGLRSKDIGKGRLAIATSIAVGIYVLLYTLQYWEIHRHDYGDPNDNTKPWKYGGTESSP